MEYQLPLPKHLILKKTSATTLVNDYLYCVNEAKELFLIDPTNGKQTLLSNMPEGSNTCAVDQPINWCIQ
jgi:hypothetical protein